MMSSTAAAGPARGRPGGIFTAVSSSGGHLDLLRLRRLLLRKMDLQNAVLHPGVDLVRVHGSRERERAVEGAVRPLHAVIALLLDLPFQLPFPAKGQDAVLVLDADLLLLQSGKLRGDDDLVV